MMAKYQIKWVKTAIYKVGLNVMQPSVTFMWFWPSECTFLNKYVHSISKGNVITGIMVKMGFDGFLVQKLGGMNYLND